MSFLMLPPYWMKNPAFPFGPVVEKQESNSFISRSLIEIIISGEGQDIPWITGIVSEEEFPISSIIILSMEENVVLLK